MYDTLKIKTEANNYLCTLCTGNKGLPYIADTKY